MIFLLSSSFKVADDYDCDYNYDAIESWEIQEQLLNTRPPTII